MKQYFLPPVLHPKIPPLSLACRTGDLLFVSGTPGYDADMRLNPSFTVQFETAIENLRVAIEQGGGSLEGILKINLFLTRPSDIVEMNRIYARAFGPAPYPARTTVIVAGLPDPEMLVELDCVVELGR
ncbi:RidA family protein [Burkholderia cenocepacia]|nr:RidA family protein [Burkholderia cenocepacia]